jgi:hypothetical protein
MKHTISCLVLILTSGCQQESEGSILQSVTDRIKSDHALHQATVLNMNNTIAARSPSEGSYKEKGEFQAFLRLQLSDGICILVADQHPIPSSDDRKLIGEGIAYQFAHDAVSEWPFAVFDLNRDCLPATLEEKKQR